jgi:putative ABC transport system ATP-binding protein
MNKSTLITLKDITKIYQMGDNKLYALNNINLEIYNGEFLVVLGPSGSGKSTLMNIIGATDRPTSGEINFMNKDLTKASDRELTLYRRNEIGFIFQFYNLLPTLTALENVEVATEISKNPLDPLHALDLVGIKEYANHFPSQMSGGQQQRVSIARAIASNPHILLCDEPTGALDSEASKNVLVILTDVCKRLNKTIVLITHNDELAKVGERIVEIIDGKIKQIITQEHPIIPKDIKTGIA